MFNEQDHPRNKDGKFTFKNGRNSNTSTIKSAAEILYGKKSKEEKLDKEKRNELLNKLKDKLTPAQILYSSNDELENMTNEKGKMTGGASSVGNSKYVRPVEGKITSNFGPRKAPIPGASNNHQGIDMRAPIGTPVKSLEAGKVIDARTMKGYGNTIVIDHGIINGKHVTSLYAHLNSYNVKVGDKVKAGQIVAKSGNTGNSQAPHLHLTIKENGTPVDPKKYIEY